MLNDRAQHLLKTLVERYIEDGQPVGSRTLSKFSGLDLSPASIRNIMADLEDMGFLASPHTSAGRIPTARGYRFFVDSLLTVRPLDQVEIRHLEGHLLPDNPQKLLSSASHLLSELTQFVGVVATPKRLIRLRQVEFIQLSERRVLLVLVTTEGDVQNRVIMTDRAYSASELVQAANFLNQHHSGQSFEEIRERMRGELRQLQTDMSQLMAAAINAGSEAASSVAEQTVISGEHHLLDVVEWSSDIEKLRQMFQLFEHKTNLMQLMDAGYRAQGVQIFIGGESGMLPVDECAMVTAPYEANGVTIGTVGVIGPTRMAYDRVIPIVDITARLLSSALASNL